MCVCKRGGAWRTVICIELNVVTQCTLYHILHSIAIQTILAHSSRLGVFIFDHCHRSRFTLILLQDWILFYCCWFSVSSFFFFLLTLCALHFYVNIYVLLSISYHLVSALHIRCMLVCVFPCLLACLLACSFVCLLNSLNVMNQFKEKHIVNVTQFVQIMQWRHNHAYAQCKYQLNQLLNK